MVKPLLAEVAVRVGDGSATSAGRYRLNAGSMMTMEIPALRKGGPVNVIVDLASAKFAAARIQALAEHDPTRVAGSWIEASISDGGIEADLEVVKPADAIEAAVLPDAVRIAALARAKVPFQVSIGAGPGDSGRYEAVESDSVTLNGRTYAKGDLPLFILYGAEIHEASIVTFGADDQTGAIAAKKPTQQESNPMADRLSLKATLAKFPGHTDLVATLYADDKADDEITAAVLKAKDDEIAALKAQIAAAKCSEESDKKDCDAAEDEKDEDKKADMKASAKGADKSPKFRAADSKQSAPVKFAKMSDAMAAEVKAGSTLRGLDLIRAVRAKHGDLPAG